MEFRFQYTVCLVDDDLAFQEGFQALAAAQGFKLVCYSSADEFLHRFEPKDIGCILLDVQMPGMSGLDLQEILHRRKTPIPVLILTGHANVPLAVKAVKTGALDVLEKPVDPERLMEKLDHAFQVYAQWREIEQERQEVNERLEQLSRRQLKILELMASGMDSEAIAQELGISRKALDIHRAKVLDKMKARSWADLTRWFLLHKSGPGGALKIKAGGYLP